MPAILTELDRYRIHAVMKLLETATPDGLHRDRLIETIMVSCRCRKHEVLRALTWMEYGGSIERCGMGNRYRKVVRA